MPVPVNFEEALDEASVALAIVFDGMIIAKIHSHFKLLKTGQSGSRTWKCLSCGKTIAAPGDSKPKHHVAQRKGGNCTVCPKPNPDSWPHTHPIRGATLNLFQKTWVLGSGNWFRLRSAKSLSVDVDTIWEPH